MPKQILAVDFSEVFFSSVFGHQRACQMGMKLPLEFIVLKKLFSYLKAFPGRDIYIMCDGTKTWRKEVYPEYKAQRKAQREKHEDLDWTDIFLKYGRMISDIENYTPMLTFRDDILEADDLEAILAKDGEDIIIFSSDKDLNQLTIYPNLKLVSPKGKKVKGKFVFKVIEDPIKELDKLVMKGDVADNVPRASSEAQKIINNKIVNLINLPTNIEARCRAVLNQARCKTPDLNGFCELYRWQFVRIELKKIYPNHAL